MKSIRRHLTLVLTLSMTALLAASGVLIWTLARQGLVDQFDTALLARARILAENIEEDDDAIEIDKNLLNPADDLSDVRWEVLAPDGTCLLHFAPSGGRRLPEPRQFPDNEPVFYPTTMDHGVPARAVSMRFDAKDDKEGLYRNITLVTALPAAELKRTLRSLALVLSGTGCAAVLLLVPLLKTALRRGLQPLGNLSRAAAGIDAGKLDTRLDTAAYPEEIQPVAGTLNALLERLETSFARERRFSSDVAHELRTPVAELRSLAELVAGWPAEATPEAFADVGAIAREMEDIVNRLTLLSRADSGTLTMDPVPTDLTRLVQEALDRAAPALTARNHVLASRLQPVTRSTDPALWRMILTNLIGNAAHHAPNGSTVQVSLTEDEFSIANPAPDLTAADLPRMFDRFWRKDGSRSGYQHSGLGLSLVASLAARLGLRLHHSLTEDGSLRFTLSTRAAASPPVLASH